MRSTPSCRMHTVHDPRHLQRRRVNAEQTDIVPWQFDVLPVDDARTKALTFNSIIMPSCRQSAFHGALARPPGVTTLLFPRPQSSMNLPKRGTGILDARWPRNVHCGLA